MFLIKSKSKFKKEFDLKAKEHDDFAKYNSEVIKAGYNNLEASQGQFDKRWESIRKK